MQKPTKSVLVPIKKCEVHKLALRVSVYLQPVAGEHAFPLQPFVEFHLHDVRSDINVRFGEVPGGLR